MAKKSTSVSDLNSRNAAAMADIVVDAETPEALRVQVITKMLEGLENDNFFETVFKENLSLGECPGCGHINHWVIPEDELNRMGFVSHEEDERVPQKTDAVSCESWQQACKKKKVSI